MCARGKVAPPGPREVRIRVEAAGVSFADLLICRRAEGNRSPDTPAEANSDPHGRIRGNHSDWRKKQPPAGSLVRRSRQNPHDRLHLFALHRCHSFPNISKSRVLQLTFGLFHQFHHGEGHRLVSSFGTVLDAAGQ